MMSFGLPLLRLLVYKIVSEMSMTSNFLREYSCYKACSSECIETLISFSLPYNRTPLIRTQEIKNQRDVSEAIIPSD